MPELLLPCLILVLAIITSAVVRSTSDHQRLSSDRVVSALMRQTILGCGALAVKANLVQSAPSASDLMLAALALIGLELLPLRRLQL